MRLRWADQVEWTGGASVRLRACRKTAALDAFQSAAQLFAQPLLLPARERRRRLLARRKNLVDYLCPPPLASCLLLCRQRIKQRPQVGAARALAHALAHDAHRRAQRAFPRRGRRSVASVLMHWQ